MDTSWEPGGSSLEEVRMVIFTSGTTGVPKGVLLTDGNYAVNRATFEQMLGIGGQDKFAVLVVNPLHHTNSTAICDLAIRRPGSHIHLVERYGTPYWKILAEVAEADYSRIVAPTVSRHFDFLDELAGAGRLPVETDRLKRGMAKVDFLIGSAPVGPKTIECLERFSGKTPFVRFGSTETCLQVIGIPRAMAEEERLENFKRGRGHRIGGEAFPGYYIGRPHPPHTEARIVRSIDREAKGFLEDVPPGTPGYLIVRGGNVMKGYVADAAATREVFEEDWYLGLKDICFALQSDRDGELDYFWMSRDASLLIRGGANYACEQVGAELQDFVSRHYGLPEASFDLAVVGIKVDSEHEDACCVTIELKDEKALALRKTVEETFIEEARKRVSKGARPDYLRFAGIPKNFKGAVLVPELKESYEAYLSLSSSHVFSL
jgi:acyl-CoA synthetase (AMP-forming)/AMP-acid ligase II